MGIQNCCINIRYIYSACIVTSTPDLSILHDPWFTEGIYDGSWFHYPKINDPIESIGNVDCIFISHIHPDHYDIKFLKKYFDRFGLKKILIANHSPNYLLKKMSSDGLNPTVLESPYIIGNTSLEIIPHSTNSKSDVDSAIIIKYFDSQKDHCVVNANDIIFDSQMIDLLVSKAGNIDILLCGYTGAGPYPQTYFELDDPELRLEALRKKEAFFKRYQLLTSALKAKVNIPFAGKYILGGKLSALNSFRGVSDPVEILNFDEHAVVLSDNGGEIDTSTLLPSKSRTTPYDINDISIAIDSISHKQMDYERLINFNEIDQLPIKRLLSQATTNALLKSEVTDDYFFCIKIGVKEWAVINANKFTKKPLIYIYDYCNLPTPRNEILIDMRYLFGLLCNIYHWNNAEIGSQYYTKRIPNIFNRSAQYFLNFLSI